jgi:magnesium transporter
VIRGEAIEPSARESSGQIVNCVAYSADGRRVGEVDLQDIGEILRFPGQFVWIGLHEPSEELLREVQREFGLHDLAVEDAHRAHQRPKLEEYGDSLFVVLRTAQRIGGEVKFGETHLFVGPRYVVSVRHGASLPYTDVRARCEAAPQLLRQGPGFVLYAIMDFIVDNYFPIVEEVEEDIEALEAELFDSGSSRDTTRRIYDLKAELLRLKRAISPLVEVCNRLVRFDLALVQPETRLYFRDVYDHVIRINETIDTARELLTGVLETNLALMSVRQNEVMKQLAAWAAILAVPTMIAGIYGMNFEFMPELHWPYGYPLVLGATGAICGILYWNFKRRHWL